MFSTGMQKFCASQSQNKTATCILSSVRGRSGMYESCMSEVWVELRGARPTPVTSDFGSVMVSATSSMLSGEVNFWVYNAHVACQCVVA